jgi:large subunit ribosomal protein L25
MAVEMKLAAETRSKKGTAECRRMRRSGLIPANIYGHNEPNASVVLKKEAILPIVQAGVRVLDLTVGGKEQKVMVREVQWDAFSREVHHVDLLRIDPDQRVTLPIPLELRGQAAGTLAGGHLEQQLRSIEVECKVLEIPDSIKVRVNALEVGQSIHVRDLEIPPGVKVLTNADALVVHVVQAALPLEPEAEAAAAATAAEPELIRKPEKEKEEEE